MPYDSMSISLAFSRAFPHGATFNEETAVQMKSQADMAGASTDIIALNSLKFN